MMMRIKRHTARLLAMALLVSLVSLTGGISASAATVPDFIMQPGNTKSVNILVNSATNDGITFEGTSETGISAKVTSFTPARASDPPGTKSKAIITFTAPAAASVTTPSDFEVTVKDGSAAFSTYTFKVFPAGADNAAFVPAKLSLSYLGTAATAFTVPAEPTVTYQLVSQIAPITAAPFKTEFAVTAETPKTPGDNVVDVDPVTGLVTVYKPGVATVTLSGNGLAASVRFAVTDGYATLDLTRAPDTVFYITQGGIVTLGTVALKPVTAAKGQDIATKPLWEDISPSKLTGVKVDAFTGKVTATADAQTGTCTVRAFYGTTSAAVTVHVLDSAKKNDLPKSIPITKTLTLTADPDVNDAVFFMYGYDALNAALIKPDAVFADGSGKRNSDASSAIAPVLKFFSVDSKTKAVTFTINKKVYPVERLDALASGGGLASKLYAKLTEIKTDSTKSGETKNEISAALRAKYAEARALTDSLCDALEAQAVINYGKLDTVGRKYIDIIGPVTVVKPDKGAAAPSYADYKAANGYREFWWSSDDKIATVDQTGGVVPVSEGKCSIYYSMAGARVGTCAVTVASSPERVVLKTPGPFLLGMYEKNTVKLTASVEPKTANKTLVWSSSDESVAKVDPVTGAVTAKGVGDAVITATAKGPRPELDVSSSALVMVLELYPKRMDLFYDPAFKFTGKLYSGDAIPLPEVRLVGIDPMSKAEVEIDGLDIYSWGLKWTVSNAKSGGVVEGEEYLFARMPGKFTLTAALPGTTIKSKPMNFEVLDETIGLTGIELRDAAGNQVSELKLTAGQQATLWAHVFPADHNVNECFTIYDTKPAVAATTIATGTDDTAPITVTAKAPGESVLTCYTEWGGYTAKVKIIVTAAPTAP